MDLLDQFSNLNEDQTQGLLAAAAQMLQQSGPSLRPTGFGQIMGGAYGAYQDSTLAARKRKLDEQQAAQMAEMRALQMQEMQGGLADRGRAREQADGLRQFYVDQRLKQVPTTPGGAPQAASAMPGGPMSPKVGGPDWMQAFQADQPAPAARAPQQAALGDPYSQRMVLAQELRGAGHHAEADAQEAAALKFKPKYETKPQVVRGPDGSPMLVQTADDGTVRPISGGYGVAEKLDFRDMGGTVDGLDPYSGKRLQSFTKTKSFADRNAGARLQFDKEQAVGTGPDASEAMIDAIGMGKMAPPSGYALRNPKMLQMMERVAQKYPEFDATEYDGKKRAMRDFTTGRQGDSIRSFAVATDHLTQLKGLIGALDNKDIPLVNKYANIIAQQTGSTAPTNFDAAKGIVAKEVLKSIVAGGGGVEERQELAHLLDNAKTTKQLNGVVDTYLHLMGAQKQGLERQYELSTGRKDAATRFNYKSDADPHPPTAAQHSIVAPNGKTYSFPDAKALANFKLSAGLK
jgi:hypothetical protein